MIAWNKMLDMGWLIFLVLLFVYFLKARHQIRKLRCWHETKGRIVSCEWTKKGHLLWPKVEYTYEVDGTVYTGEHIFLDTMHNSPSSQYARQVAYRVANAYKSDEVIDIFYDPENPSHAVLDRAFPYKVSLILVAIFALITLQLGIVLWSIA